MPAIRVCEIYRSIQGESTLAGLPCAFVRTAGCDLRCRWCDSTYAFTGGEPMEAETILARVRDLGMPLVEVTGGEPLLQPAVPALCQALLEAGFEVLVETGGHRDIAALPAGVRRIVDIKCPGSGMADRVRWENLDALTPRDELKFVLADRADYEWARGQMRARALHERCPVLVSAVHGELDPAALAAWVLDDGLPVRLQVQLHKILWPGRDREV